MTRYPTSGPREGAGDDTARVTDSSSPGPRSDESSGIERPEEISDEESVDIVKEESEDTDWDRPRGDPNDMDRGNDIDENELVGAEGPEHYEELPARGQRSGDVTTFVPAQADWSLKNLPGILYQLKRGDMQEPSYRLDRDWIEPSTGRPLPDPKRPGENFKEFRNIPRMLSSKVEGWRLEAWCREDSRVRLSDLRVRIQYPTGRMPSANALQMRKKRFREQHRMQAWNPRNSTKWWDDQIEADLTPEQLEANSTRGLQPYSNSHVQRIRRSRRGSCPTRAGKRGKFLPNLQLWRLAATERFEIEPTHWWFEDDPSLRNILDSRRMIEPQQRPLKFPKLSPRLMGVKGPEQEGGRQDIEEVPRSTTQRQQQQAPRDLSSGERFGRQPHSGQTPLELAGASVNERGDIILPSGEIVGGGLVSNPTRRTGQERMNVFENPQQHYYAGQTHRVERHRWSERVDTTVFTNSPLRPLATLPPTLRTTDSRSRRVEPSSHRLLNTRPPFENSFARSGDLVQPPYLPNVPDRIVQEQGWIPMNPSQDWAQDVSSDQMSRSQEQQAGTNLSFATSPSTAEGQDMPMVAQGGQAEPFRMWLYRTGRREYEDFVANSSIEAGARQWSFREWARFDAPRIWRAEQALVFPGDPRFAPEYMLEPQELAAISSNVHDSEQVYHHGLDQSEDVDPFSGDFEQGRDPFAHPFEASGASVHTGSSGRHDFANARPFVSAPRYVPNSGHPSVSELPTVRMDQVDPNAPARMTASYSSRFSPQPPSPQEVVPANQLGSVQYWVTQANARRAVEREFVDGGPTESAFWQDINLPPSDED
ncbi:MAG: hypothetical protein M4579_000245 [Chaenotheca gracillima]|nr:MAG: hypothetical protein M4579_000245 [Chaenotheca gracillima]